jgi:hypothetical protein
MPMSTPTGRARSARRSSMAGRARATATTSRWARGRCSPGSSRRLHQLGRVRAQSGGARQKCLRLCGRRLHVVYNGRYPRPVYRCDTPNLQLGQKRCFGFGGKQIDAAVAGEMLRAVAPMAIEAAREAERMLREQDHRRRIAELELRQAQYDASLAERRYAACDPDNRLIAAQLEKA